MNIPRVVHQTWRTADVPPEWRPLAGTWRRHHPHWEHRLWTDADNQRLVDDHYPEVAAQYASCSYGIQRADLARYLILHRYGGVYVDLDMECLRPLDLLIEGRTALLTIEPAVHASWIGRRALVSTAFMAAAPRHPLFDRILELLLERDLRITRHVDVLTTTGPVLVEDALGRLEPRARDAMVLVPPEAFSPLESHDPRLERLRHGEDADSIRASCLAAGAWAIHHWSNSWVRGLAGPLVNEAPDDLPGYVFHPGMDSLGFDLHNAGRDIRKVADACSADSAAAGFNTDGFLKRWIRPRHDWVPVPHARPGEGLYVRRAFHFGGRNGRASSA
jgi:hypothetical protein